MGLVKAVKEKQNALKGSSVYNLFANCTDSIEYLKYHPERYLGRHIALVTLKAQIIGDPNLLMVALFHDICKPCSGQLVDTEVGPYWQNRDHAIQASELVRENDDIRYFIKSHRANLDLVSSAIYYHMAVKEGIPKAVRKAQKRYCDEKKCTIPLVKTLDVFARLDDMVQRKLFPHTTKDFHLPGFGKIKDAHIWYVGQSIVQRETDYFTVTVDRTPFTYHFNQLPLFFDGEIKEIIHVLTR